VKGSLKGCGANQTDLKIEWFGRIISG